MTNSTSRSVRRWIAARRRRWRHPLLARSIACPSDQEIDKALDQARLRRADLFTAADAIAHHRLQMAHMIAALELDVERAADQHWERLKQADGICLQCTQKGRCRRWLEWGGFDDAPRVFCPNSPLFTAIAIDQASQQLGRHMV